MDIIDVLIIGKGPAGISASLYTSRAGLNTVVIGREGSALEKADRIENFYGQTEPVSGRRLLAAGEKQAQMLGVNILNEEAASAVKLHDENIFKVATLSGDYYSKALLIATGQPQKKVNIDGLKDYEGRGVSYCTTCDGFFYRNMKVGVLGNSAYAIHEAMELEAFTNDITLFTNGAELNLSGELADRAGKYKINTRPVLGLAGDENLQEIRFKDGRSQKLDGLFIAYGTASSIDFALKLGIATEGNAIVVDTMQKTSIEGVFAAGDCTGGLRQIATAVGQGAVAGKSIIEYVRSLTKR